MLDTEATETAGSSECAKRIHGKLSGRKISTRGTRSGYKGSLSVIWVQLSVQY